MFLRNLLYVLSVGAFFCVNAKEVTKDEMLKNITSIHTAVWSRDNMLTDRLNGPDTEKWRRLLKIARDFVRSNGGDVVLMDMIDKASEEALSARKKIFNIYIAPALSVKDRVEGFSSIKADRINFSKIHFADMKRVLGELRAYSDMMRSVQTKIEVDAKADKKKKSKKQDAREVLNRLALTLELTLEKFSKDADRLEAASKSQSK